MVGRSSISSVCRLAVCISIENTIVQYIYIYIYISFNNYRKSLRGNIGIISVSEQNYQVSNKIEIESDFIVLTFANKGGFSRLPEVRCLQSLTFILVSILNILGAPTERELGRV